jgi:hypothetical protein
MLLLRSGQRVDITPLPFDWHYSAARLGFTPKSATAQRKRARQGTCPEDVAENEHHLPERAAWNE